MEDKLNKLRTDKEEELSDIIRDIHDIENMLLDGISDGLDNGVQEAANKYLPWLAVQKRIISSKSYVKTDEFKVRMSRLRKRIFDLISESVYDGEEYEEESLKDSGMKLTPVLTLAALAALMNKRVKTVQDTLDKQIKAVETATLRYITKEYEDIVKAAGEHVTETGTLAVAIDEASHNTFARGIGSIEYEDGTRPGFASYLAALFRTQFESAWLYGEGSARDHYGLDLVIINRRLGACPLCVPFLGKVCIDDVWGNGEPHDDYPLMSDFIEAGLYHPNCKDSHRTYIPGEDKEDPLSEKEQAEAVERYNLEQRAKYNERNINKFIRLRDGAVSEQRHKHYEEKIKKWETVQKNFLKKFPDLL